MKPTHELKWHRLDNTANIFPIINNAHFSGVYRISAVLKEPIQPHLLESALKRILPHFEVFNVQLRTGVFWYYMETNRHKPCIEKEEHFPCRFIKRYENHTYLFRTGYYENKLYVEVFHALTDGYGAIQFMKELTAQYIRLAHPEQFSSEEIFPAENITYTCEDSYIKYYKKQKVKGYKKTKAYQIKQPFLDFPKTSVIHGHFKINSLKAAASKYDTSITQYLAAALIYTIYQEYVLSDPRSDTFKNAPLCLNIPVNLRQFFPSETTMNFFSITLAQLQHNPDHRYTFEEVLNIFSRDFKRQLDPAWLEQQVSYNVANEKNMLIRLVPLPIKALGVRFLYGRSSKSFTTTISNLGVLKMKPEYDPYIENFHFIMGASQSQPVKCVSVTFHDEMIFTISSVWDTDHLENAFFNRLRRDGVQITSEGNGIHQEPDKIPYPAIRDNSKVFQLLSTWYILLTLITGAGLTAYNFSHYHGSPWSVLINAFILYSWMTLVYDVRFNINPATRILSHASALLGLCILTDIVTGYLGWSLEYVFPLILITACCSNMILMVRFATNWHSYFTFQILYTIFSLIPMLLWILGIIEHPLLSILALIISCVIPLIMTLHSPKKIKSEIGRRFHF